MQFDGEPRQCPWNGHWYALGPGVTDWETARQFAAEATFQDRYQGHLATLTSPQENTWVAGEMGLPKNVGFWLGGVQRPGQGKDQGWYWITGEPWEFTNWDAREPDDFPAEEDALELRTLIPHQGRWNDMGRDHRMYPLIEFDVPPEPVAEGDSGPEASGDAVSATANRPPQVVLEEPVGGAVIAWRAVDPDGDAVVVSLWFQDEADGGGAQLIAAGLPACGSLAWTPFMDPKQASGPDLNTDGQVDFRDVFLLSRRWGETVRRYRVVATAQDSHQAEDRTTSANALVVEHRFPMQESGLMGMLRTWHGAP